MQDLNTKKIGCVHDFREIGMKPRVNRDTITIRELDIIPEDFGCELRVSSIVESLSSDELVILDSTIESGDEAAQDLACHVLFLDRESDDDDDQVIKTPTVNTWTDTHAEMNQSNVVQGGGRSQLQLIYSIKCLTLCNKRFNRARKGRTSYKEELAMDQKLEKPCFAELTKLEEREVLEMAKNEP